jgi:hypothetical protein
VTLRYIGAPYYSTVETATLTFPLVLLVGFGVVWYRQNHRRRDGLGGDVRQEATFGGPE